MAPCSPLGVTSSLLVMDMSDMDKRYDWFSVLESSELELWVNILSSEVILAYEKAHLSSGSNKSKRDAEYIRISRHIISALYSATHARSKKKLWVSFPAAAGNYAIPSATNASVDTTKIPYSYRRFCNVRDQLLKLEWIEVQSEVTNVRHKSMYPKGKLLHALKRMDLKWLKIAPRRPELLVELSDVERYGNGKPIRNKKFKTKKKSLLVLNTTIVQDYRSKLFDQNATYTEHCISLSVSDDQLRELEEAMANEDSKYRYLDFSQVQMTRIFARGSMSKGGRFYQPWWQNILSSYRKYILIDGESTVECDFTAMSLNQLYAKEGIPCPKGEDPYDLGLSDWLGQKDERRKPIKKFVNALLNDEDSIYKLRAQQSSIVDGLTHDELLEKLYSKHPKIKHSIEQKVGLKLHFEDSCIADVIMHFCNKDGIVVLPVHDSFIVIKRHEEQLMQIMTKAFQGQYSSSDFVAIDVEQGAEQELAQESIMGKYLSSWQSSCAVEVGIGRDDVRSHPLAHPN